MATIEEMANVVYDTGATPIPKGRLKESFRRLLQSLERGNMYYRGKAGGAPYTYWVAGAYYITYITDNEDFSAADLTDEMMDDLIIKEV